MIRYVLLIEIVLESAILAKASDFAITSTIENLVMEFLAKCC